MTTHPSDMPDRPTPRFIEFGKGSGTYAHVKDSHMRGGETADLRVSTMASVPVNPGVYIHRDDVARIIRDYASSCIQNPNVEYHGRSIREVLADDYYAMADYIGGLFA